MTAMRDVSNPAAELSWLASRPDSEAMTGFDASGWEASIWVLHAMYENPSLPSNVSHLEPLIIGDVNLDEGTTVTRTPLGFVVRPGSEWRRLRWWEYAARNWPDRRANQEHPRCHRWFPTGSWPISIDPPPEGSLDEDSFKSLIQVMATHSARGLDTPCLAFYGSLAADEFDRQTLLTGRLGSVPDLVQDESRFRSSPTNLWPVDRSWFVWTDWDLWGTKVSGSQAFVDAIRADRDLETTDWICETKG